MNDLFGIQGSHVLVTGGSSGLGRFFAAFLATRGARVTVGARRAEALAKTVDEIAAAKGQAQSVVMDVTVAASIETALDAAEARFGPIQIVINNAGVTATRPALQQDETDWDKVIDTNLKGVWLVAQATGRRMVAHKVKGSIVNVASILGLRVASSVAPYAISKAGVVQMTKALALEWARYGIRVNALAPGIFRNRAQRRFLSTGCRAGADQADSTEAARRTAGTRRAASAAGFGGRFIHDWKRARRRRRSRGFDPVSDSS